MMGKVTVSIDVHQKSSSVKTVAVWRKPVQVVGRVCPVSCEQRHYEQQGRGGAEPCGCSEHLTEFVRGGKIGTGGYQWRSEMILKGPPSQPHPHICQ